MKINERVVCIGHVAVDSGQLMLCDPCYIESQWDNEPFKPSSIDSVTAFPFNYDGVCHATMTDELAGELKFKAGHTGAGVGFSTGLGDGLYPVYATYINDDVWGMRISKVEVVFLINDEELF